MADKSHRKTPAAERLVKLQEQMKKIQEELRAEEKSRTHTLGQIVAKLLESDVDTRRFLLPKLQAAATTPKAKADIAPYLINDWLTAGSESNTGNQPPPVSPALASNNEKENPP